MSVYGSASEYTGEFGPTSIPVLRPSTAFTASDQARLARLNGTKDPMAPINWRVWNGQRPEKSAREVLGDFYQNR